MYFKVSKDEFLNGLNVVSRAVSVNSPLPALHGIKIAVKEGELELTASDMDISMQIRIVPSEDTTLVVQDPGEIVLESRYIVDMIRKIDSDMVEVEIVDGCLTRISGGAVNFELNGTRGDDYPLIDFTRPQEHFSIAASLLKDLIAQTCFATSDKETKPVLTGLNLRCEGNLLTGVATDSYRLARKEVTLEQEHHFNITVPAKSLNEVARIIDGDAEVDVAISDKKALFTVGSCLIQTRLIDGTYPETARLIPQQFDYELTVDARDILSAIDRASFIKNDGVSIIRMQLTADEVVISSKSTEVGSVEHLHPIQYVGKPLNISFKGQYVYEAVRALNAFQIKIQFGGEMKPFVLRSTDRDDILQLVLPIRTYA